jgi:hypothetical protein
MTITTEHATLDNEMKARELDKIAEALGHSAMTVEPTESGRRWRGYCACGFGIAKDGRFRSYATQASAAGSLVWHVHKAVSEYLAKAKNAGVSNPPLSPPAAIPSEALESDRRVRAV